MNTCDTTWDISLAELNDHLGAAGVEPVVREGVSSARDLDAPTRQTLVTALRQSVRRARGDAPLVGQWAAAAQSLVMNHDFSPAARQREEAFWSALTRIVNGCYAQVLLGDLSEFPFFIELLRHQPAGHLTEIATGVLRHHVDPARKLDPPQLIRLAEEWFQTHQVAKA